MAADPKPEGLQTSDLFNFFATLATVMAARGLRANVLIDGSASLMLQTYIRDFAGDVDMLFFNACDQTGKIFNAKALYKLQEEFCASHPDHHDMNYATFIKGPPTKIQSFPFEKVFFTSLLKENGSGIRIFLAPLDHMLNGKQLNIYYNGRRRPYAELNRKEQSYARDGYAMTRLLIAEWDENAKTCKDEWDARFYFGIRPKWNPYVHYAPPVPGNTAELDARADKGRKSFAHQKFKLAWQLRGTGLKQRSLPEEAVVAAKPVVEPASAHIIHEKLRRI